MLTKDKNTCTSKDYLTISYLFIKFSAVIIILSQFLMTGSFLDMNFFNFGAEELKEIISCRHNCNSSMTREISSPFPTITMCYMPKRHMIKVHDYIVQCALPFNYFNRKIFLFVWCWMVFVGLITIYSFIQWLYFSFRKPNVQLLCKDNETAAVSSVKMLKPDVVFTLNMIKCNVGPLIHEDMVKAIVARDTCGAAVTDIDGGNDVAQPPDQEINVVIEEQDD